ncbi:MAG: O-antigen ligase family protein [Planctomycetes bacterium]|nr:O-antigen ligase family protein [Planctomycetota bacterium]
MLIAVLLSAIPLALRFGTPSAILLLATADRLGVEVGMMWKPFYFFWPILVFECMNEYQTRGAPALLRSAASRWALIFLVACLMWLCLSVWSTGGEPTSVNYLGVTLILSAFVMTFGFRLGFENSVKRLLDSLPWVGLAVGIWGLIVFLQFALNPGATPMADGRPTGIFLDPRMLVPRLCGLAGDPNAWMMQVLPFWAVCWLPAGAKPRRGVTWAARIVLGLNLVLIGSRTGWALAVLVLAAVWLLNSARRSKAHLALATSGLGLVAVLGVATQFGLMDTELVQLSQTRASFGESRFALWKGSIEVAMDHPVLGIGPGMIATSEEMRFASGRGTGLQTHNAWLELMVEAGVPAFIFMAIAMSAIMLHSLRLIRIRDQKTLPLLSVTMAFFVILLAETSISYITSPTLWTWFFVLLLVQAELSERWQLDSETTIPDPDDIYMVPG